MARSKDSLEEALRLIPELRERFWKDVRVLGGKDTFNQSLEKAGRVADFLEFGELLARDALTREESCGGHFRVEHQTAEGEAKRDDENFCHAAVWEYTGRRQRADPQRRADDVRERQARHPQLQVRTEAMGDMNLTLHVWRQADKKSAGKMVTYQVKGVSEHASFLEMLDVLNEQLIARGEEPVAFDHDCREGICGMCSLVINGRPHGGQQGTTTCQLHMRHFKSGDEIWIEPWRAGAFPVIKDLVVDRHAFDTDPAGRRLHRRQLRVGARRQRDPGRPRRTRTARSRRRPASAAARASRPAPTARRCCSSRPSCRTSTSCPRARPSAAAGPRRWSSAMDAAGFGNCTNHYECEAACPKDIKRDVIAMMNRDYVKASFAHRK